MNDTKDNREPKTRVRSTDLVAHNAISRKQARDEQMHRRIPVVRWVSVQESQPDPDALVLTCGSDNEVHAGYCDEDGTWQTASMVRDFSDITHWAKLPEGVHTL